MATYANELRRRRPADISPLGARVPPLSVRLLRANRAGGLMLLLLVLGACSSARDERLAGRWVGRPDDAANGLVVEGAAGGSPLSDLELELEFFESGRFSMILRGAASDGCRQMSRLPVSIRLPTARMDPLEIWSLYRTTTQK